MSAVANAGSARQVEPGRLARFEDADVESLPISLPARRRRTRQTTDETPVDHAELTQADQASAESTEPVDDAAATTPRSTSKAPEDKVRPSNVHIPVTLLEPLTEKCRRDGLSHGEVIIIAIEGAYPRLNELIHPAATAGGSLFASRRSRASRSTDGPLTPLNYRLRVRDYQTLDQLVEEFKASSRGQLITAALQDYFGQT